MAEKRLDVLIFGATGFTGKYTVKEAARLCKNNPFSWGVAGRNKERLNNVIKEFAPDFGIEIIFYSNNIFWIVGVIIKVIIFF